jgi:hypothetical protein
MARSIRPLSGRRSGAHLPRRERTDADEITLLDSQPKLSYKRGKQRGSRCDAHTMPVREQEIDDLARYFVETMMAGGAIRPKADAEALIACIVELLSANFEMENQIDEEADRMAEAEARKHPGLDVTRLRSLIKQRIAQRKDFTI